MCIPTDAVSEHQQEVEFLISEIEAISSKMVKDRDRANDMDERLFVTVAKFSATVCGCVPLKPFGQRPAETGGFHDRTPRKFDRVSLTGPPGAHLGTGVRLDKLRRVIQAGIQNDLKRSDAVSKELPLSLGAFISVPGFANHPNPTR
jgi:hypothetical protein